jgi:hypothetical protein
VVPAGSSAHLISCHAARWPPSGRKSTYPTVQFCQATSMLYKRCQSAFIIDLTVKDDLAREGHSERA